MSKPANVQTRLYLGLRKAAMKNPVIMRAIRSLLRSPLGAPARGVANRILSKSGGYVWQSTPAGDLLVDPLWDANYFASGVPEPEVNEALDQLLKPSWKVYDVGCHAGFFSLYMLRRCGPEGKLVCLDADPDNAKRCQEALARSGMPGSTVCNFAVWSSPGTVRFTRSTGGRMSGKVKGEDTPLFLAEAETIEVESRTLDSIADEYFVPDLVKMDIEGAEYQALLGAIDMIKARKTVFLVEVHEEGLWTDIDALFKEHGYNTSMLEEKQSFPVHLLAKPN